MTDYRDSFARFNAEAHVAQHPILVFIGEIQTWSNSSGTGFSGNASGIWRRSDLCRRIEQLKHSLASRHGGLQDIVLIAQVLDRAKKTHPVLGEREQSSHREGPAANVESAIADQQHQRECPRRNLTTG